MLRTKYPRVYIGLLKPVIKIINNPETIRVAIEDNRKKILDLLTSQDMAVSDLANILRKDISTVYRHVHKLESAGLVEPTGEKKTHHIPEIVYGRTAKVFLFSPEAAKEVDPQILVTQGRMVGHTLLELLKEMGYEVDASEEFRENFVQMFIRMNHLTSEGMQRVSQETDREISLPLFILLMLAIAMINKDSDPELKAKVGRFLSGVKMKK